MIVPVCPICGLQLNMGERSWVCGNRHSFDVARQGYVNLLPVTKKHSLHPGDTKEMVSARRQFLDGGAYRPIADRLCEILRAAAPAAETVLDAGCGEGYYLETVGGAFPGAERWGVDISKDAVRYAAGRDKSAHWLTGTAAALPFADRSFDVLLSMFALTVPEEYARVLKENGVFIQVLAGEEHLMGLKNIIYPEILRKEKFLAQEYEPFELSGHQVLEFQISLDESNQIQNLLSMTPHFWRISEEGAERLCRTQHLDDTAQVVFNIYRKKNR